MKGIDGTIAFRVPAHGPIRELVKLTGPLFSTSATITQEPIPHSCAVISPTILESVECLVGNDSEMNDQPSAIIDCRNGLILVVRQGSISSVEILASL